MKTQCFTKVYFAPSENEFICVIWQAFQETETTTFSDFIISESVLPYIYKSKPFHHQLSIFHLLGVLNCVLQNKTSKRHKLYGKGMACYVPRDII